MLADLTAELDEVSRQVIRELDMAGENVKDKAELEVAGEDVNVKAEVEASPAPEVVRRDEAHLEEVGVIRECCVRH